ncbi:DUF4129 domain-containing protein [Halostella pelagica]|uniref:DUF4129 domain-containing protein n=1 Tax=Halostella pelagica TaxID=2583824 RepID=UPI0010804912|nr:DUF4129 domain-containing protein [Halostella pelagica]
MDREALRPILVAIICVLAISVAAATLTSPVDTESGGGPQPEGAGHDGTDDSEGSSSSDGGSGGSVDVPRVPFFCVDLLSGSTPFWIAGGILVVTAVGLTHKYDAVVAFGLTVGLAVILLLFLAFLMGSCAGPAQPDVTPPAPLNGDINMSESGSGGLGTDGEGDITDPTTPSILLFAILVLTVGMVVGLYVFSGRDTTGDEDADAEETDTERRSAIGNAAGRAADRIENADDLENEVYRAWREMTGHLDVDRPESSTPAEFADAAVDAGMTDGDVDELTQLFEEVRYGGKDPTDDREQRALAALRRIESEYADDGGDW